MVINQDQQWINDYARNLMLDNIVSQKANILKKITNVSKDLMSKSKEFDSLLDSKQYLNILEDCFENKLNADQHDSLINTLINHRDYTILSNMLISGIKLELRIQERILDILISKNRYEELNNINKYRNNLDAPIQDKLDSVLVFNKLKKHNSKNTNPFDDDDDEDCDWE